MSNKLLISSCLLGETVRFDAKSKGLVNDDWLIELQNKGLLFRICPEVAGGLPVPRPPAEIKQAQVITVTGQNVTKEFESGAKQALALCQTHNINFALLKANSPSCGNDKIYDGSYSGKLIDGQGVTAKLLTEHGIKVFSELEIEQLKRFLDHPLPLLVEKALDNFTLLDLRKAYFTNV